MSDPRVAKLGELLVNYSLELQPGDLLRSGGEVYADGELVWKAGRFLHEPGLVAVAS